MVIRQVKLEIGVKTGEGDDGGGELEKGKGWAGFGPNPAYFHSNEDA